MAEENDVRVLIPRVRRAIDGPEATSSAALSTTLDDNEVKAVVADAIAAIIFYTQGQFGHTLDVAHRDDAYGAPDEWTVNPPLSEAESTLIAVQAALDSYFYQLRDLKTSETIKDEGQEWTWSTSATVVKDRLAYLRDLRDKALELLAAQNVPLDSYSSFIEVRDCWASAYVERWLHPGFGGQELEMAR